jgi:hypothetical protein
MMLVGTSLGGCLRSLALGEVNKDDVLVIITRTSCKEVDSIIRVVEEYHRAGNAFATKKSNYDMTGIDLDLLKGLAQDLYYHGKIHQPQLYNGFGGFVHVEMSRNQIWIPLAPSPKTDNEVVVEAYEKFKTICNLYK